MRKKTNKLSYSGEKRTGAIKHKVEKKTVITTDSTSGYYDKNPCWMFQRCDFDHPKWGMLCNASELTNVFKYLAHLEKLKWGEILTVTSGRRSNTRNHHVELVDLVKDAQKRAVEINVDEFDSVCSIAIEGQKRVWGHISDGIFYIIWFDMHHEIYPYEKRNT